jgi:glyoxylase-like metal-dependent hydrolase (beta-lactamase superfamily II)
MDPPQPLHKKGAPPFEEVLPDLFRIEIPLPQNPLKATNSYVIRNPKRNLVIDTGLNRKACLSAMKGGLEALEVSLEHTDFFITHLHADHFALISELVTDSNKVYFNRPDAALMQDQDRWRSILSYAAMNGFPEEELRSAIRNHPGFKYGVGKIPALTFVKDGDTLSFGRYDFECIETPGHTRGHICLYAPRHHLFVAGDHILNDITPNIQCWSRHENPLKNYLASLDKVSGLKVDLVLPGHRRLFTGFKERIGALKMHHRARLDEIRTILKNASKDAYRIASEMTWDIHFDSWDHFPVTQKWFATGEALAHLQYLNENQIVRRDMQAENVIFSLEDESFYL